MSKLAVAGAHVVVTGASRGIGAGLAMELARRGAQVTVVARSAGPLAEVARVTGGNAVPADLGSAADIDGLVSRIEAAHGPVDMLINNAGLMSDGHLLKFSWAEHEMVNRVMALVPAELIYRLLPGMLQRGWGQVINAASAAGFMPSTPFNTFYGPIKNYLVVLTRTLAAEYGGAGVTFTAACPGPVHDTGIIETEHGRGWSRLGPLLCTPRQVTSAAHSAAERGRTVTAVDVASRGVAILGHVLPAALFARAIGGGVMFLGKEKRITSAAQAGIEPSKH
jgi:uncharacterized protein